MEKDVKLMIYKDLPHGFLAFGQQISECKKTVKDSIRIIRSLYDDEVKTWFYFYFNVILNSYYLF